MWRDTKDVRKVEDMIKEDGSEGETNWMSQNQNPSSGSSCPVVVDGPIKTL